MSHADPHAVEAKGTGAYLAEFIGTLVLVLAITGLVSASAVTGLSLTNLALVHAPKGVAGAAIGGALALGVLIFAPATGASFNPARWFGPAAASGTWTDAWLYILAPVTGAVVAAFAYLTVMGLAATPLPAQSPRRGESAEPPIAVG